MIDAWTNHIWQSTLFAVVAGLMTLSFRHNRAPVRFWLWFSASLKFFIPLSLLMSLGSRLEWALAAANIATPAVSLTMVQIAQPFSDVMTPGPPTNGSPDWGPIAILFVWACGFSGVALVRFRGWLRIRAALRASAPIHVGLPVEVRSTPGLLEPGVVGILRPILLLPAGITERLTPPQLEAVLAHELCHVRRRDNLFASIHMIVEAVFWFHPLVWWIGARLLNERERACDEEVLRLGNDPHVYAEGILNICKLYVESPLVCVSGVTGSNLKNRIEAIMKNRIAHRLNFTRKVALATAAIAALAVPVAIGVMNGAALKFETASIQTCGDEVGLKRGRGYSSLPGKLSTGCMPLADEGNLGLIQRAYVRFAGGHPNWPAILPIQGGPAWIRSELYAIHAEAAGKPSQEMMEGPMMRAFLEDRFKLKIRRETKEVPVYALTAAESGARLKPSVEGSCIKMPLTVKVPPPPEGRQYCKMMIGIQRPSIHAQSSTLTEFSQLLDMVLDRPVIDKTGIAGKFDINLEFAIDEATPRFLPGGEIGRLAGTSANPAAPSIFKAIQLLGLKLEATKGRREFLVIDHVEKPAEN